MTEMFTFDHHGVAYEMPRADQVKGKVLRAASKLNDDRSVWYLLEQVCTPDVLAAWEDMTAAEIGRLYERWQTYSGVSVPESSRSSSS
jgi:hypothetical protein